MRLPFLATLALCTTAHADRHVVQRGETLEHVARAHGCATETLLRANRLRTTLVRPGTVIAIPECSLRSRARTRTLPRRATREDSEPRFAPLRAGNGYVLRRPERAFGEPHVVAHVSRSIGEVRALYPDVHTLAVGDLSAPHGGKLDNHRSHQQGLDVDVGFYFRRVPEGYPEKFAPANADLDLEATWALLLAFARTVDVADGVEIMFLDRAIQRRLYTWAKQRGTPAADLAYLLQYPRGAEVAAGLVRHWPNHADHLHVRFRARR